MCASQESRLRVAACVVVRRYSRMPPFQRGLHAAHGMSECTFPHENQCAPLTLKMRKSRPSGASREATATAVWLPCDELVFLHAALALVDADRLESHIHVWRDYIHHHETWPQREEGQQDDRSSIRRMLNTVFVSLAGVVPLGRRSVLFAKRSWWKRWLWSRAGMRSIQSERQR